MKFNQDSTYEKIQSLFDQLKGKKYLSVKDGMPQQDEGTYLNVFSLEKSGEHYYLLPCPIFKENYVNGKFVYWHCPPIIDSHMYIFVILPEYPCSVFVGTETAYSPHYQYCLDGHTSISLNLDVLYAGSLRFQQSKLLAWSNMSGHYKPESSDRFKQLTPNVKRILPEEKFYNLRDFLITKPWEN
ncbi:MAG: hypothetical protein PUP46_07775 [Endozoicomonas sp. (ex Botrylloides leachii)]|nr:hypothetical protein [Endozoicomonas sp. (ex Botrylloides leachii)]